MNDLITIFMSGGFSAILCAWLVWLFRTWIGERMKGAIQHEYNEKLKVIEHAYSEKLESHKSQLKASNESALEILKNQLQTKAAERNIKLTSTFEKQAEVIAEIYKNLLALKDATDKIRIELLPRGSVEEERLAKEFAKANHDFIEHFFPNEIYLPNSVAQLIHKFALALRQILTNQNIVKALESENVMNDARDEILTRRYQKLDKLEVEIPELLKSLRNEFQNILGVKLSD